MPTPLDRALNSRNLFVGFAGIVTAATAWMVWGQSDIFPKAQDPKGDPEQWSACDMKLWLTHRNLMPVEKASREELLARVKANMRAPAA